MLVSAIIASGAVPLLARLATRIGLVDIPDARKTHSGDRPLCGGIAIAIGVLVPLALQGQPPFWVFGYLISVSILLCLGILDDWHELVFFWRLLGQFVAATIVVIFSAPFLSFSFGVNPWDWLAYPASVVFIVAVTNAINFMDGLDGLAAGCVVLSLVAVIFMAFQNDAYWALVIATALMGSLFGFVPYNSYPATAFMGDAGSTFIGFSLAVTALVGCCGEAANPLMPVLIVGLPLFDMVGVVLERIGSGRMPFHADRRHIHHKLLAMNVPHGRAVSILSVAQAVMVTAGVVFCHEMGPTTLLLFAMFLFAMTVVPVRLALASGWRQSAPVARSGVIHRRNLWLRRRQWLPALTIGVVQLAMSGVLLAGAFVYADLSSWRLGLVAVVPAALLALSRSALASWLDIPKVLIRLLIYTAIASVGFITVQRSEGSALAHWVLVGYALLFTTAVSLAIRLTRREIFQITSGDILAILAACAACIIFSGVETTPYLGVLVLTVPHLYAAELFSARRSLLSTQVEVAVQTPPRHGRRAG